MTLLAEVVAITTWARVWLGAELPISRTSRLPHEYEALSLLVVLYVLVLVGLIGTRFQSRPLVLAAAANIPLILAWAVVFGHATVMTLIVGAAIWGNLWLMLLFKMFSDRSEANDEPDEQPAQLPIARAFAGSLVVFPAVLVVLHHLNAGAWSKAAYSAAGISFAGTGLMIALKVVATEEFMLGCGVHIVRIAFFAGIGILIVKHC